MNNLLDKINSIISKKPDKKFLTIEKKFYPKDIKSVFAIISLNRKYKINGTSSLIGNYINTDYDLSDDVICHNYKDLVNMIVKMTEKIQNKKNVFLIDFKIGEDNNHEPLRWKIKDIKKGVLKGYKLKDCLKQDSTVKVDVLFFHGNELIEMSDIFFINQLDNGNYKKINQDILKDAVEYYKEKNYFKFLKRVYAISRKYICLNKISDKLQQFFNGESSFINSIKSSIENLEIFMEKVNKRTDIIKIVFDSIVYDFVKSGLMTQKNIDFLLKNNKLVYILDRFKNEIDKKLNELSIKFMKKI